MILCCVVVSCGMAVCCGLLCAMIYTVVSCDGVLCCVAFRFMTLLCAFGVLWYVMSVCTVMRLCVL